MPLNQKQQEAVEYLEGPLLVLAGPGTGKTQLLANKVQYILNNTDTNPENILCLTFTEAGVEAMYNRLLSMRVEGSDRITISTYHGFGIQILNQYKNYAERFDRVMDEPIDPVKQYKLIKSIIEELPATDILRSNSIETVVSDVIDIISQAKAARLTGEDLHQIALHNIAASENLSPILSLYLDHLVPRMKVYDAMELVYVPIAQALEEYTSETPIVKHILPEANAIYDALSLAIADADSSESIRPLSKWKDSFFEKDQEGNYRLKNRIANKKLLSLSRVMTRYEELLRESGQFDFNDMIEESIKALRNDPGFKATLQERYQFIMLDEFQDTNPSQFEIVHLLTDYEKPAIMAVGDDDQAIYAFQGARASNLTHFVTTYGAKVITLTENYRSTAEILDFSHKIADQIGSSFAKLNGTEKVLSSVRNDDILSSVPAPLKTTNSPDEASSYIKRHEFISADAEYAWVAKSIYELIQAGEKQHDIAILAPKHKYLLPILPYLKKYFDINIAYERRENILEEPLIIQLATLSRFIYDISLEQNPSSRLLEILSYDFWQLNPLLVITEIQSKFKDSRRALDYLAESKTPELKEVANFIANAVAKSFTTPLEEFINLLATRMGQNLSKSDQFAFYECLSVLRESLKSYVTTDKPRLKDFIEFLDDYEAASATILNTSPYQDSENSIQILSAHKSKGLEFKHVFMISVDSSSWGKAKGNNNQFTLPKNLESIRHTGITEDEQLRLLFVAITRAEQSLTMTNSVQNYAGQKPKRLEYLQEYEVSDGNISSPLLPNTDVIEHYDPLPDTERLVNVENYWLSNYFKLPADALPQLQKRLENYRLTASDLTGFIDIAYAGPLEFYLHKVLQAPSESNTAATNFGNVIHATFEAITNQKLAGEQAFTFLDETISKLDVTDADAKLLTAKSHNALTASLREFNNILHHPNARAEVDLRSENLVLNINNIRVPITGKIDHINIDDDNKTIEIYDFKTGHFNFKDKWGSTVTLYKYALQLAFYKFLLNTSVNYSKYTVTKAHILYVNPNNDGEVYDKVLEFTSDFEDEVKDLIAKVYTHIKSLDFIDENSPLHIQPDDSNKLKEIRAFIENL